MLCCVSVHHYIVRGITGMHRCIGEHIYKLIIVYFCFENSFGTGGGCCA